MVNRDELYSEYVESNSHGQTIHELADYMEENAALKARVAELE